MPATGTLFVRVCPTDPETSTPVCYWQEVDSGTLSATSGMTPEQLHDIVNGVIWILALIFIFSMLKKAIEQ